MKDYTKIYAIIFWSSLVVILVWLLLKAFGFINTPLIIELIPLFSAVFGAGAFFQMVFDIRNRLIKLENGFKDLGKDFHDLDKRLYTIEKKI